MMVTATDFKTNLGYYLSHITQEEVTISKNGKPIAKLVPYKEYVSDSLVGVLNDGNLPESFDGDYRHLIREMRRADYEDLD
ncbi:MAG: type II toxin-antitoxin system Phd/YefM family antitoxin [Clostridiales bacterium]|nr:type II toxin-antitoxin system Phd/YefM family antitoxin [Clostridiales bacterium]